TALLIGHLAVGGATLPKRALSVQPLPWIGRISYGMYLFHTPVNEVIHHRPIAMNGVGSVVLMSGATIVLAAISCLLIERPALRLKRRFGSISEDDPQPATA